MATEAREILPTSSLDGSRYAAETRPLVAVKPTDDCENGQLR